MANLTPHCFYGWFEPQHQGDRTSPLASTATAPAPAETTAAAPAEDTASSRTGIEFWTCCERVVSFLVLFAHGKIAAFIRSMITMIVLFVLFELSNCSSQPG